VTPAPTYAPGYSVPLSAYGAAPGVVQRRVLAWQARISSCARTRVRATSAVIMIFHDTNLPAAAMLRCDQGRNQSAVVTRSLSQSGDRPGAAYAWGASVALGQHCTDIAPILLCKYRSQK
jgi:hypothetical protein